MDYYRITERDVQFTNCRYCLKYYPKNMIITEKFDNDKED